MNNDEQKKVYRIVFIILITGAIITTFGGLVGMYVNKSYRYNCDELKPNVSYTETSCIAFNQTKVFVLIKNCERKDIAFIAPRSNESENYYKTWIKCWYPDSSFNCLNIYPGMPLELNISISYTEPKVFQMWRDAQACEIEYSTNDGNIAMFSVFFSIFGAFWLGWSIAMIIDMCKKCSSKK